MKKFLSVLLTLIVSAAAFAETAVMLRDKGPLRIDDTTKGGAVWSITVPAGTSLELKDSKPVTKTMITSKGNIDNCSFYRVKYNNKEYLALEGEILIGKTAGLLLRDTVMFTKPQFSSFVNARLEKATVIGVGKTVTNNGAKFVEVTYYSDSLKTRYILEESYMFSEAYGPLDTTQKTITTKSSDITAMLLLAKAAADDDLENKRINIDNALSLDLSEEIAELVNAEKDKYFKDEEPAAVVSETSFVYEDFAETQEFVINTGDSDNARIRAEPKTGDVLGSFPNGTYLRATKAANEGQDGKIISTWYYVTVYAEDQVLTGWISSTLVEGAARM